MLMIGVIPLPALMKSSFSGSGSGSVKVPSTPPSRTIEPGWAWRTRNGDTTPSSTSFGVIADAAVGPARVRGERVGAPMVDAVHHHADAQVLPGLVPLPLEARADDHSDGVLGLALDPLDPAPELAGRPERVDQLEVVVREEGAEQRLDRAQGTLPNLGDLGLRAYFRHIETLPAENMCQTHVLMGTRRGMATLRATREQELVAATRALFDERGMQEAPIEEIARSVGIARGLIYRQFSSKEELFVLTVTDYLAELAPLLEAASGQSGSVEERVERCVEAFAGYCQRYPAFLDCQMALMRRPARELHALVSESVWLRLGQGMAACLDPVADAAGSDYLANFIWTQLLGSLHLLRIGVGVRQEAPGVPGLFRVDPDEVTRTCVAAALAIVERSFTTR